MYVETDAPELHCFELSPDVKPLWATALGGEGDDGGDEAGLAGAPLETGEGVIIASRDGRVRLLDRETGAMKKQLALPLPLDSGPLGFGQSTLVTTIDGSVYRVDVSAMSE